MPELPELEVVRDVLHRRIVGTIIEKVQALPPGAAMVLRDLTHAGIESLAGRRIASVTRRGKFLLFAMPALNAPPSAGATLLVVNPKLTGRLQLSSPTDKRFVKTHLVLTLSSGQELRYVDQRVMGQVYLTQDLSAVPDFDGMGPEPMALSLDDFRARLRQFRGEIKGILTRGQCVAGIGNAYADEILWAARLYPYRKRTALKPDEIERLYHAMRDTLIDAVERVRVEMGEEIHLKPRDFLCVHMKTGEPCPRCGTPISLVGANQRITNFCRNCQPGGLIKGM